MYGHQSWMDGGTRDPWIRPCEALPWRCDPLCRWLSLLKGKLQNNEHIKDRFVHSGIKCVVELLLFCDNNQNTFSRCRTDETLPGIDECLLGDSN